MHAKTMRAFRPLDYTAAAYIEAVVVVQVEDVLGVLLGLEQAPKARDDNLEEVRHLHVQRLRNDLQHLDDRQGGGGGTNGPQKKKRARHIKKTWTDHKQKTFHT